MNPRILIAFLALFLLTFLKAGAEVPRDMTTLPLSGGLPVQVRTGLYFIDVESYQEHDGTFAATVDLRLKWKDGRLAYDLKTAPSGFVEFRDDKALAKLAEQWAPLVELSNSVGDPVFQNQLLRVYPDGQVEWLRRVKGQFRSEVAPENFPFDHQQLAVHLTVRNENERRVTLDFRQDDLDFSGVESTVNIPGWKLGLVNISRSPIAGFYGESNARLIAALGISRALGPGLGPIFIPLMASLLIPLMAVYMNKVQDGEFQIEAFELSNIVIGGLFAVIALNFTVNSDYPALGAGDNAVSRLFGLNYLVLAAALAVIVLLFRFNIVGKYCGKYVQEQLYLYIVWAAPVLVFATAAAIVLIAAS